MAKIGTLLTYDVYKNHEAIKKALLKAGWKDTIVGDSGKVCHLPNTTFWHSNKTASIARDEFKEIAEESNVERLICYDFQTWAGRVGEPHKND